MPWSLPSPLQADPGAPEGPLSQGLVPAAGGGGLQDLLQMGLGEAGLWDYKARGKQDCYYNLSPRASPSAIQGTER